MAGEQEAVSFLANLLALPHTIPAQAQGQNQNRALLEAANQTGHMGLTPEQLDAFAPKAPADAGFPGANVPVLGSLLRGVGTAGYLLQTALGTAPAAPRPPLKELAAISQMQAMSDFRKGTADLAQQRFGETERHNLAMEGNAAARLLRMGRGRGGGGAAPDPGDPLDPAVAATVHRAYGMPAPRPTTSVPAGNDPRDAVVQPTPDASTPSASGPDQTAPPGARQDKNGVIWVPSNRSGTGKTSWKPWTPKEVKTPTSEFGVWQQQNPGKSIADYEADKAKWGEAKKGLTSATRTMIETAPHVMELTQKVEHDLAQIEAGPWASRLQNFTVGKIGLPSPDFKTYQTDVSLLTTLLMRMHVGARGGGQMMEHFQKMLDAGIQSPENMKAATAAIRDYAQTLVKQGHGGGDNGNSAGGGMSVDDQHKLLDQLGAPR